MTQATASSETTATGVSTPWRMTVHNIEACNCRPGCNCQFTGFPDDGGCEAMIGGEVQEGSYGDVALAGVRYVIAFIYPKAIHEGGGNVAVFIDERATPAQADAIAMILSGRAGGMPFEALAGTVASLDGPVLAPIEMTVNRTKSAFRIPGVLELAMTPILDAHIGPGEGGPDRLPERRVLLECGQRRHFGHDDLRLRPDPLPPSGRVRQLRHTDLDEPGLTCSRPRCGVTGS